MEPRIQYAKTEDGVSIAYWTMGEGMPPLLYGGSVPFSHIELEWQVPELRAFYEHVAQKRKLVVFDHRGVGMSARDVSAYSLDALLLDLEAVVNRVGLDRFALYGLLSSTRPAIAYAVRHPERLSHLILVEPYARASDLYDMPRVKGLLALLDSDWEMYTETLANVGYGWEAGEPARRFAAYLRQCVTPEVARAFFEADEALDIEATLSHVRTPTLVLRRRQVPFPSIDVTKRVCAQIPDARLVVVEGGWMAPDSENTLVRAIDEFLGEGDEAAARAKAPAAGGMITILFTDVEGSTALTQRLGDAKARDLLREHERMVREALKAHGGSEVKTMGDGFMASFSSATKALECAIAMQRAFAEHNETADEPIKVRVGMNAGEPIAEDDDLFGTAVNEAARITATAKSGEILVSDVVRELVKGKNFLFADRGEATLKGFDEPVRLFEVRWREGRDEYAN